MSEKTKHKVNPRRRVLIRLIVGIALITGLVSVAIYALRPISPQIVFIVNLYNPNIWIAEVNHPENARQLTYYDAGTTIISVLQISGNDDVLYETRSSDDHETWILNLRTFEYEVIEICQSEIGCSNFSLQTNGNWVAYIEYQDTVHAQIKVFNLVTAERQFVSQIPIATNTEINVPKFSWLDGTDILIFPMSGNTFTTGEFGFYSISENSVIDIRDLNTTYFPPVFSSDGSLYAYNFIVDSRVKSAIIREFDDSNNMMLSLTSYTKTHTLERADIFDWHLNNSLLIGEVWHNESSSYLEHPYFYELNLYNIYEDTVDTLAYDTELSYSNASFNADGSQILYSKYHSPSSVSRLAIYDIESGEELEIALPLGAYSALWVDGGRS